MMGIEIQKLIFDYRIEDDDFEKLEEVKRNGRLWENEWDLEFEEDEKMEEEEEEDHKMHEGMIEDMHLDYKTGDEAKDVDIPSEREEIKEDVVMEETEDFHEDFLSKLLFKFIILDEYKRTHEIFKKSEVRLKIPKIILDKFQALIKRLKKTLKEHKSKPEE